jgi:hypothetical protein
MYAGVLVFARNVAHSSVDSGIVARAVMIPRWMSYPWWARPILRLNGTRQHLEHISWVLMMLEIRIAWPPGVLQPRWASAAALRLQDPPVSHAQAMFEAASR